MDAWNGELFDAIPLSGLRLTFTGGGRALCSYRVHASVADEEGNWHPGAIATVIDDIGAASIMSVVGEIKISVDFSISFFSRAKIGDEVEIEAKIAEDNGRLTAVVIELRHKETGRLVAIGRQWMSFSRGFRRSNL
ncbi:acyl-coenzyme A thioesterase 13-like [Phalaenopsis equestris]|uniref:acyl-coenzyme A thioesterase 13-like n=1 Tax=Phalaenopsis equestris TaxID=78828 RepID=UPI0009E5871E|nr:acyl-coenzyme A thioesterase 13-like [Phalaenopsis equestris]